MSPVDPRDKYKPKHPTPLGGVPAETEEEREARLERLHGGRYDEERDTPVNMPIPMRLDRIGERTKDISNTGLDIQRRVGALEKGLTDVRVDVGKLETMTTGLDSKVDVILEEAAHQRREREEREKRAETRTEAELERRSKRNMAVIAIVVPTISALGALVAAIVAARNSANTPAPIVNPAPIVVPAPVSSPPPPPSR